MKKLIKNGMIVTESQVFQGDILIEDEIIKSIGAEIDDDEAEDDDRITDREHRALLLFLSSLLRHRCYSTFAFAQSAMRASEFAVSAP